MDTHYGVYEKLSPQKQQQQLHLHNAPSSTRTYMCPPESGNHSINIYKGRVRAIQASIYPSIHLHSVLFRHLSVTNSYSDMTTHDHNHREILYLFTMNCPSSSAHPPPLNYPLACSIHHLHFTGCSPSPGRPTPLPSLRTTMDGHVRVQWSSLSPSSSLAPPPFLSAAVIIA